VAVVSNVFAKTIAFMSQAIRVSTAWGSPNVAAIPARPWCLFRMPLVLTNKTACVAQATEDRKLRAAFQFKV
jgi:hypothetical protein